MQDREFKGKDHRYQPFDFFTSRKTKKFFKEDYVNLSKAATNKEFIMREYRNEISKDMPWIKK